MSAETFEYQGKEYSLEIVQDHYQPKPWKEFDCHGEVCDWTSRDKAPGELILATHKNNKLYYDFQATTRRAKAEGWGGVSSENLSFKQRVRAAVLADFEHLQKFCDGRWYFACLTVTDPRTGETEALGGVEYADGGIEEVEEYALELAGILRGREVWAA